MIFIVLNLGLIAILNDSLTKAPMKMEKWVPFLNLCGIALLFIETFITLLYR